MMDWGVSVGEGAGVMEEIANVLRIMLMTNGGNDSNFFFLEDYLVSSYFSRILVSLKTHPVRAMTADSAIVGGAGPVGIEGSTKGVSESR